MEQDHSYELLDQEGGILVKERPPQSEARLGLVVKSFLWALVPSFITSSLRHTPNTARKIRNTSFLDGLRGLWPKNPAEQG
jgi:hypothetical protein